MADKIKYEGPTGIVANRAEYSYSSTYTCVDEEKQIVEVIAVSRCKDGKDVYHSTRFDFSTFEKSELLELAARPSIISARTPEFRTRNAEQAIEALEGKTLNAKDYFKREKRTKSFEDKVQELVDAAGFIAHLSLALSWCGLLRFAARCLWQCWHRDSGGDGDDGRGSFRGADD